MKRSAWKSIAILAGCLLALGGPYEFAHASLDPYAQALDISRGVLRSSSTGSSDLRAICACADSLAGFPYQGASYVIMSTGLVSDAGTPDLNNDESVGGGGVNDDVSTALQGSVTNQGQDLVQLSLTLRPPGWAKSIAFDFAFFTEEWPDFYNTPYNDTFLAEVGESRITVGVNGSVTAPNNVVFDENGNLVSASVGFGLNPEDPNPDTRTTYDGTTGLLTTLAPLPSGQREITLIFSILDVGDSMIDSAVFIDNVRFSREQVDQPITQPISDPGAPPASYGRITGGGFIEGASDNGGDHILGTTPTAIESETPGVRIRTADEQTVAQDRGSDRGQAASRDQNEGGRFSGIIRVGPESSTGHWQYTSLSGQLRMRATRITAGSFARDAGPGPGPGNPRTPFHTATIEGEATVNGESGYTFTVWVADRGEPGREDTHRIQIRDPQGNPILDEGGRLAGGNIQLHPSNRR